MERFDVVQKISGSTWRLAKTRLFEHPCFHFFLHNTYCRLCGDLQNNPSLQTMREEAPPICRSWFHKWKWLYDRNDITIKVCQKCGLVLETKPNPMHYTASYDSENWICQIATQEELTARLNELHQKDAEWDAERKKEQTERKDGRRKILENWKGELGY